MEKKFLALLLAGCSISTAVFAQNTEELKVILQETNREFLAELSKERKKNDRSNREKALARAQEKGWVIHGKNNAYGVIELQGMTDNDKPVYYISHNVNAAASTSTDKVWKGGASGLNLDGTGIIIGEWDEAAVKSTHQEFTNTGDSRVLQQDIPISTEASIHSTHVAGTLIAAGVDSAAMGMASNATLYAWDWWDAFSEIAAAASDGLLLSNHSYGYAQGWYWDGSQWQWNGERLRYWMPAAHGFAHSRGSCDGVPAGREGTDRDEFLPDRTVP